MDPNTPENKVSKTTTNNQTSPTKTSSSSSTTTSITRELRQYKRSYTCTFCEKGFSNAQALGGHMNIHRRDRARIRNMDDSELGTKRSTLTMISWDQNHGYNRSISDKRDRDLPLLRLFDVNPTVEERSDREEEVDLELRLGITPRAESRLDRG